ncbi:Transducin (beta)-like 3 [Chytridiales sp. JEL 0842]|nr:Transducin (beta)-like 3 [Chytridiales sp. JEL 0842]
MLASSDAVTNQGMATEQQDLQDALVVLYASQTGNAEWIAKHIYSDALARGFNALSCHSLDDYAKIDFSQKNMLIVVASTTGDGDPPDNATKFMRFLRRMKAPEIEQFKSTKYAILGLGDTNYTNFCQTAKRLDRRFAELGAVAVLPKGMADDGTGLEQVVDPWIENLWKVLPTVVKQDAQKAEQFLLSRGHNAATKFSVLNIATKKEGSGESTVTVSKDPAVGTESLKTTETHTIKTEESTDTTSVVTDPALNQVSAIEVTTVTTTVTTTTTTTRIEVVPPAYVPVQVPLPTIEIDAELEKFEATCPPLPPSILTTDISTSETRTHHASLNPFHFLNTPQNPTVYTASNPYSAILASSRTLTGPKALKPVFEVTLDIASLPWPNLQAGDVIGLLAPNPDYLVIPLLQRLGLGDGTGVLNLQLQDPSSPLASLVNQLMTGGKYTVYEAFRHLLDLHAPPRKPLLRIFLERATEEVDRRALLRVLSDAPAFKALKSWNPTLLDLLETFPSVQGLTLAEILEHSSRLQPRWYSICKIDPTQKAISIAFHSVSYIHETSGRPALGHATTYLQHLIQTANTTNTPVHVAIFPKHVPEGVKGFYLPSNLLSYPPPMLFISAGTGLTPFISFLEKLEMLPAEQRPETWVIHGRRFPDAEGGDRIYGQELDAWVEKGVLGKWVQCISRWEDETAEEVLGGNVEVRKGYVQAAVAAHGEAIWRLVRERGAYLYVCGSTAMAKDVHVALVEAAVKVGGESAGVGTEKEAKKYWSGLSSEGSAARKTGCVLTPTKPQSLKPLRTFQAIYTGGHAEITKDEKYLVSTVDKDLHVLELETGKEVLKIEGEADDITCFAVKPNGDHVVSASRSLLINIVDMKTGEVVRRWKAHEAPVLTMAFDSSSTLVATGSADSTIRVWDVERGHGTHLFKGHSGVISALCFYSGKDSRGENKFLLASASDDCKVRIWDLSTRSCVSVLDGHASVVRGLAFTEDGQVLVSGGRDKILNVWNLESEEVVQTIPIHESVETIGIVKNAYQTSLSTADSPGIFVYTGGEKGIIRIWDTSTGTCVLSQTPEKNSKHEIQDIIYLSEQQQLVAVTSDQNFLFYDLTNKMERCHQIVGYNDEVIDLAFVTGSESRLAVASNSEQLRVYDLESSNCEILYGHTDVVLCLDKSTDGTLMASGSKDHNALVWKYDEEADKFESVAICVGHTEAVGAIAFSRKTTSFVVTGSQDRTIKVWDISSIHKTASSNETQKLKSQYTFQAHDKDINSIAIAPNDKVFATGSQDKTAKIWSTSEGTLLGVCKGHRRGVWSVVFSNVDQVLATSSGDKTIKLWSVSDYSCLKTFEGHLNSVLKVSFVTVGMQIVSVGSDGLVKLWNIKNNECVATFDNHDDKIWALTTNKSESFIVTGSADSKITIWEDCTEQEELERSQANEEKILKEQELSNHLLKKDYKNAIILAMELDQPYRLLKLFEELHKHRVEKESATGLTSVDTFLRTLDDERLEKFLKYIQDWNTNTKYAHIAQNLLNLFLASFPSDRLLKLPRIKETIEAFIPYTERHFTHADELLKKSYVIGFTLHRMNELLGGDLDKLGYVGLDAMEVDG